ncbi:hypothetical protein [Streptomyces scabiei]|uniref:hypothetical protein n=1 Tax=Streptomyces scabiei TaxID=1930 RepID=UPI00068EA3A1|nr:hypothetical protein [Streptomyces scabiei]MDX2835449.1 hypothetical protein [Streptomyces scabiei]MDX3680507.1 hypothetical protein [Streptomyces scabiei]
MTTKALYEIETSEGGDGTTHPAEQLWTPCADDDADSGFIAHHGLHVTGIDDPTDDHLYPVAFLVCAVVAAVIRASFAWIRMRWSRSSGGGSAITRESGIHVGRLGGLRCCHPNSRGPITAETITR